MENAQVIQLSHYANPLNSNDKQLDSTNIARKILSKLLPYRRMHQKARCENLICFNCAQPHLEQMINQIERLQAIEFVLPAFPAKSPNPNKVLGTMPDKAEHLALQFLQKICNEIEKIYPPGARIILCSDGRVFNDILAIPDQSVSLYQRAIHQMIKQEQLNSLSIFDLDNVANNLSFEDLRLNLICHYAESLSELKLAIKAGANINATRHEKDLNLLFCGIQRFLSEDLSHPQQSLSKNARKNLAKQRAYLVIQRSRAWGALLVEKFPMAVRLSIHPQYCGSKKLGIKLIENETWVTPWHSVAMRVADKFYLVKRQEAESLGAKLIYEKQQPSYYELI